MSTRIHQTHKRRIDHVKNATEKQVADRKSLDQFFSKLTFLLKGSK